MQLGFDLNTEMGVERIFIQLPVHVNFILDKLKDAGFEGYVVGGCVRDILTEKQPKDWDICTDASPVQAMNVFSDVYTVIPTGIKHGTVTVVIDKQHFEITTYRIDGNYGDNRRPDSVHFTTSITEDLARRDFTINAMAYNPAKGLVDPFNGKKDIENHRIICVGNADSRIKEDYLRALRAVRFSCQLNFKIEQNTVRAIMQNKELIKHISRERIRDELCKILISSRAGYGIRLLIEFDLLKYIAPGLELYTTEQLDNICMAIDRAPDSLIVRLSILLNNIYMNSKNVKEIEDLLRFLKFDNRTINRVTALVNEQKNPDDLSDKELKKMIVRIGIWNIDNYFDFMNALHINGDESHIKSAILMRLKERYNRIIEEKQPLSVKDLNISGNDLLKLGFRQGKDMGLILNKLLELVLEDPELNQTDVLIELASQELNR